MASKSTTKTLEELNREGVTLLIPRIFKNITSRRVKRHMIDAQLGIVERVDLIPVRNPENKVMYNRAFVHFAPGSWNMRDDTARKVLEALSTGKEIHFVYEEPWFWKAFLDRKSLKSQSRAAASPAPSSSQGGKRKKSLFKKKITKKRRGYRGKSPKRTKRRRRKRRKTRRKKR